MPWLPTEQVKRLAEAIYMDERLKGKITVGLFIGEAEDRKDTLRPWEWKT